MKELKWDPDKNEWLKDVRGVSFDEIIQSSLLFVDKHPSRPNQKLMIFAHQGHAWLVPYVETENELFLKTLYKSRKYTALCQRRGLL